MPICRHEDCGYHNSPEVVVCAACHRPLTEPDPHDRVSASIIVGLLLGIILLLIGGLISR